MGFAARFALLAGVNFLGLLLLALGEVCLLYSSGVVYRHPTQVRNLEVLEFCAAQDGSTGLSRVSCGWHEFDRANERQLVVHDLRRHRWRRCHVDGQPIRAVLSPDGRCIACCDTAGQIRLLDLTTSGTPGAARGRRLPGPPNCQTHRLRFSADGRRLAAIAPGGVRVWRLVEDGPAERVDLAIEDVLDLDFSPDCRELLMSDAAGTLCAWPLADGATPRRLAAAPASIVAAVLAPDQRRWAALGADSVLRVWSLDDGRLQWQRTLANLRTPLAWSQCGRLLASTRWEDGEAIVELWCAETGAHRHALTAPGQGIDGLCFTPDGRLYGWGPRTQLVAWRLGDAEPMWRFTGWRFDWRTASGPSLGVFGQFQSVR